MDALHASASCCCELPVAPLEGAAAQPAPPAEVQLLPPGPVIAGRDGRAFRLLAPLSVVAAFGRRGRPAPIDRDHVGEEPLQEAPAAGWIVGLRVAEDGSIWGAVEWTPRGAQQVVQREYRWISPVFLHDRDGTILEIVGGGLTNRPNLSLRAINARGATSQEDTMSTQEKTPSMGLMDDPSAVHQELLTALGLAATADRQEVMTAVNSLKAAAAAVPDLSRYVPRQDYDSAAQRAANAEARLAQMDRQAREDAIEGAIAAALAAGKIVPATADYYRSSCRQEGGLEAFRVFCAAAPAIAGPTSTAGGPPAGADTKALDAPARAVCAALGLAEDDYLKAVQTAGGK